MDGVVGEVWVGLAGSFEVLRMQSVVSAAFIPIIVPGGDVSVWRWEHREFELTDAEVCAAR
ncbi:hypothetical protein E3N86_05100 [Cryobacterium sp. Hz7]|uniref:Uncharacterized protein n=1 Tax=Cryobacterium sandaracinum TaxID=1259247 RepID=A0ABY2JI86_9MICO|nr:MULTISPECIES: hypothetical protein [Cryobacterium]TFB63306.1 hypothetical protein E3N86_05100 [Cryobacterium sp. Hz7]TFD06381.1 hypothetical protein E3T25_02265 [Cryobacterium sandaracinum]